MIQMSGQKNSSQTQWSDCLVVEQVKKLLTQATEEAINVEKCNSN